MDTTATNNQNPGAPKKKKAPIVPIIIVLVILAAIATYFFLNKTAKQKYFLAEKDTFEQMSDYFTNRYEPEIKWQKSTMDKPTETDYNLGVKINDTNGFVDNDILNIVNSSKLGVHTATDYDEMISTASLAVNVGPFDLSGLNFGLTADEFSMKLPFLDDAWFVKEDDLYDLMVEAEPSLADAFDEDNIDFASLFETTEALDKEDWEYIEKEYIQFLYKSLDDDYFKDSKEKIEVDGQNLDTEVIEMHLTEKQFKKIIKDVAKKAKDDERLQDIMFEEFAMNSLTSGITAPGLTGDAKEDFREDFRESMNEIILNVDTELEMPDGITSKVWIDKGSVVQREVNTTFGYDSSIEFEIEGEQLVSKDRLYADYNLVGEMDNEEVNIALAADSTWKKNEADDEITLTIEDFQLVYSGEESLKDGKRDYDRNLAFIDDDDNDKEALNVSWTGNAKYDSSKTRTENKLTIDLEDLGGEILTLNIEKDSKHVDSVEKPDTKDALDFGNMSTDEIETYFFEVVIPKALEEYGF